MARRCSFAVSQAGDITPRAAATSTQRPVIIDTDIGSDIDDSFAIGLALQSSEYLDVKLIVTCTDDTAR